MARGFSSRFGRTPTEHVQHFPPLEGEEIIIRPRFSDDAYAETIATDTAGTRSRTIPRRSPLDLQAMHERWGSSYHSHGSAIPKAEPQLTKPSFEDSSRMASRAAEEPSSPIDRTSSPLDFGCVGIEGAPAVRIRRKSSISSKSLFRIPRLSISKQGARRTSTNIEPQRERSHSVPNRLRKPREQHDPCRKRPYSDPPRLETTPYLRNDASSSRSDRNGPDARVETLPLEELSFDESMHLASFFKDPSAFENPRAVPPRPIAPSQQRSNQYRDLLLHLPSKSSSSMKGSVGLQTFHLQHRRSVEYPLKNHKEAVHG
jgi:hypothetical protein